MPRVRIALPCLAAALLAAGLGAARADDGVVLTVRQGFSPAEVRLDWTGGAAPYQIYRSASPATIVRPENKLGETTGLIWLDLPPDSTIVYYLVVGPCLIPTPEVCNGVDDDCDGRADNGCDGICSTDDECDAGEHCGGAGTCVPDLPDGSACGRPAECRSDYCEGGVCCGSGDCCATAAECSGYGAPSACDDPSACQGSRTDGVCGADFRCAAARADDDSGCAGRISNDCGPYPAVACTAAVQQPADQAALCPGSCQDDNGCDVAAHCDNGVCVPDGGPGALCEAHGDCTTGQCVDSICCTGACAGTCRACDLVSSPGTCSLVPDGSDPDAECGAVSCSPYYWGWLGDTCYRKADVGAALAACGGDGACRTQAEECALQTVRGGVATTCHSLCQDPVLSTCTGTTAGACVNVNPGTQTCGIGACQRTVAQCSNGAPLTCTPGAPTTETCNNVDDNCDGSVDNGPFSDGFESNNACTSYRALPTVGSDQTRTVGGLTVYPAGDLDYFLIPAVEDDSSCGCGIFAIDEDYDLRITLTLPAGSPNAEFCTGRDDCGSVTQFCTTATAGTPSTWAWQLDGACPGNDAYNIFVRVRFTQSGAYDCSPYSLSYFFDAGLCR